MITGILSTTLAPSGASYLVNRNGDLDSVESLLSKSPMQSCVKYKTCNANICPLDTGWRLRSHLRGESTCNYLRLIAKDETQGTCSNDGSSAYEAAKELWQLKEHLPKALVTQLERLALFERKRAPVSTVPDPVKAERAMQRLQQLFGETLDKPINRFG